MERSENCLVLCQGNVMDKIISIELYTFSKRTTII